MSNRQNHKKYNSLHRGNIRPVTDMTDIPSQNPVESEDEKDQTFNTDNFLNPINPLQNMANNSNSKKNNRKNDIYNSMSNQSFTSSEEDAKVESQINHEKYKMDKIHKD